MTKIASNFFTLAFSYCCLRSGVASMIIEDLLLLIKIEDLNLLFLGFFGLQLPHEFPIAGTPDELPQPKMLISTDIKLNSRKD